MPPKWWKSLHTSLNAEESLEALAKESIDAYDVNMREGLGILQLLVMHKNPDLLGGKWSPIMKKISTCEDASKKVTEYLLSSYAKKDQQEELQQYLQTNLQYITPSTYWLLKE